MSNNPFTLKGRRQIYKNPWIDVREDAVIRPDGSDGIFGVVKMVHGVSVLPILHNGDVLLAREYKYALDGETIEVFSGAIDSGETPRQAGQRELREESGYSAERWIDLGFVDPFTTVIESRVHLFLAMDAVSTATPADDPGEQIDVVQHSYQTALDMVMASTITHAPSCVLLLKARDYVQGRA